MILCNCACTSSDLSGWNRTGEGERCIWDVTEGEPIITEFIRPTMMVHVQTAPVSMEIVYNPTATQSLDICGLQLADQVQQSDWRSRGSLTRRSRLDSVGTQSCYGLANVQLKHQLQPQSGGDSIALSYQDIDGSVSTFDSARYRRLG